MTPLMAFNRRGGVAGQIAGAHGGADPLHGLRLHGVEHPALTDERPNVGVAGRARLAGQVEQGPVELDARGPRSPLARPPNDQPRPTAVRSLIIRVVATRQPSCTSPMT